MTPCPQCKKPIEGVAVKTFGVGWCERDIHHDCLQLHIRSCAKCRPHNEAVISKQEAAA